MTLLNVACDLENRRIAQGAGEEFSGLVGDVLGNEVFANVESYVVPGTAPQAIFVTFRFIPQFALLLLIHRCQK